MNIQINKNINLEFIKKSHAKELYELTDNNRDFLRKWLQWVDYTNSQKDTLKFIESSIGKQKIKNGFDCVIKFNGKIAGVIGIVEISKFENSTEIGYWLGEIYTGKGIMTKSCAAVVNYCFDILKLSKIKIRCDIKNKESRGIPERLNFFKQGVLKHDIISDGKFSDLVQYVIRKNDFKKP